MEARIGEHPAQPEHGKHGAKALRHKHEPVGERQFFIAQRVYCQCVRAHVLQCSKDVVNQEKERKHLEVIGWVFNQQKRSHGENHTQLSKKDPWTSASHAGESISVNDRAKNEFSDDPRKHTCRNEREFLVVAHRIVVNEEGDQNGGYEKPGYALREIQRTNRPKPCNLVFLHVYCHVRWSLCLNLILIPA